MVYANQCLSSMAMLINIFNIQAEVGWWTGRACQLFNKLKQISLTTSCQGKLNEIHPNKGEDLKMICNKIEALKVKQQDQAEILDKEAIVMHFFGVCKAVQIKIDASSN